MVAVERVNQFSTLPSEAAWKIEEHLPSPNWPTHGDIEIKDIKVSGSYLPLFLLIFPIIQRKKLNIILHFPHIVQNFIFHMNLKQFPVYLVLNKLENALKLLVVKVIGMIDCID